MKNIGSLQVVSRQKGWARYGRKVAVIEVNNGKVVIRTGHICSTRMTYLGVDNIKRAIVWCDEPWRMADNADDEHEYGMHVIDPHFVGADEIGMLQYPELRKLWFGNLYSDEMLAKIADAVRDLVFPKPEDDPDIRAITELTNAYAELPPLG